MEYALPVVAPRLVVGSYRDGISPTISRKVRLKVPRLVKPTEKQMSVMLRPVSRSRNTERPLTRVQRPSLAGMAM